MDPEPSMLWEALCAKREGGVFQKQSEHLPQLGRHSDVSHCLLLYDVRPLVVVLVVETALVGTCTAFPLLDTSRVTVELMAESLARFSVQGSVAVGEMREVEYVGFCCERITSHTTVLMIARKTRPPMSIIPPLYYPFIMTVFFLSSAQRWSCRSHSARCSQTLIGLGTLFMHLLSNRHCPFLSGPMSSTTAQEENDTRRDDPKSRKHMDRIKGSTREKPGIGS